MKERFAILWGLALAYLSNGMQRMQRYARRLTCEVLAEYDACKEKNELSGMLSEMDAAKAAVAKSIELAEAIVQPAVPTKRSPLRV